MGKGRRPLRTAALSQGGRWCGGLADGQLSRLIEQVDVAHVEDDVDLVAGVDAEARVDRADEAVLARVQVQVQLVAQQLDDLDRGADGRGIDVDRRMPITTSLPT